MDREGRDRAVAARWKEWRRRRALELHERGWTQVSIAEALGVTEAAVSQWFKMAREGGPAALQTKSREGQAARLSEQQLRLLPALLDPGAEAYGFLGALWTCPRIAYVIEKEFGVRYHPDHVRRLLHRLDWTYQKPVLRASQRDEAVVSDWLTRAWPAIKKKLQKRGEPSSSSTSRRST